MARIQFRAAYGRSGVGHEGDDQREILTEDSIFGEQDRRTRGLALG